VAYAFGAEYQRMNEEMRGFRAFLAQYFASDLDQAVALNTPILELTKQILLKSR
jgi:hypothetical protein